MRIIVHHRYRLFQRRNGIFFIEDSVTRKQNSLQTRDKVAAQRIFNARNEAHLQPAINLQIARAYLTASDPLMAKRTWQHVMEAIIGIKTGENQIRWKVVAKSRKFDSLRQRLLITTQAEHFLLVLQLGTVSTNVYLRRMHNFALDMNWLPASVIPKRQWPPVKLALIAGRRATTILIGSPSLPR